MVVTNKIGAMFVFSSSAGPDVFPVIVGQLIDQEPITFLYLQVKYGIMNKNFRRTFVN